MNKLIKKNLDFVSTSEAEAAFVLTKEKLMQHQYWPVLEKNLILFAEASDVAISGISHQEQDVVGKMKIRPIACGSKILNATGRRYGAAKAEMLAAVKFVQKF